MIITKGCNYCNKFNILSLFDLILYQKQQVIIRLLCYILCYLEYICLTSLIGIKITHRYIDIDQQ